MQRGRYIGAKLREIRTAQQLTQEEVARRAGIARTAYNRLERDKEMTGRRRLARLAEALGVSPLELGGGEEDAPEEYVSLAVRLEAVEARLDQYERDRNRALAAVTRRLADYEEGLESLKRQAARRKTDNPGKG